LGPTAALAGIVAEEVVAVVEDTVEAAGNFADVEAVAGFLRWMPFQRESLLQLPEPGL
jgi:hypothetical protein